jgi:hypothetical protein
VSFVVKRFPDVGDSCNLLPILSAKTPTRLFEVLLKTKAQPQFDRAMTARSKLFRVALCPG